MRPVVFSASSVNSYRDCHLQWWFTYIATMGAQETEQQAVGNAVHAYAEDRLRRLGTGYISNDTLADPAGQMLLRVFDQDILPTYRNPIHVERAFQIDVDGIPFSGILDSIDQQDVPPMPYDDLAENVVDYANVLRDLKTTGSRPGAGKYRFNMVGYFLGAEWDLGVPIHAIQLDYVVRTKKPYYWPEVQPLPDEVEVAGWARTLHEVAEGVARQDWEPTGLGTWQCGTCPHRSVCGPAARFKEITGG